jgi:hypothetical protein
VRDIKQRLTRAQFVDPKGALLEQREYGYGASPPYQTAIKGLAKLKRVLRLIETH